MGKKTQYAGYLSCFCQEQYSNGVAKDAVYPMRDGSETPICQQYDTHSEMMTKITNGIFVA